MRILTKWKRMKILIVIVLITAACWGRDTPDRELERQRRPHIEQEQDNTKGETKNV